MQQLELKGNVNSKKEFMFNIHVFVYVMNVTNAYTKCMDPV